MRCVLAGAAAAVSGVVALIVGWYTAMAAGVGDAYGAENRAVVAAVGLSWMIAGATAIIAASAGVRYRGPAAAAEAGSAIVIVAVAVAAGAPLGLIPAGILLAASAATFAGPAGPAAEAPASSRPPRRTTTGRRAA
ncbi:MAG TPA: hypothetical protein VGB64_15200 [Actinomycetota bacterium]